MSSDAIVDFLIGDELKAFDTIKSAASGHPVSSDDVIHAGLTIGSDLLWIVPGLGPAVKGAKYAGKAATAARAAKTGARAVRAGRTATAAAVRAGLSSSLADKARKKAADVVSNSASAKYKKALKRVKKKKMTSHRNPYDPETVAKYRKDAQSYNAKAAAEKQKYKSKTRKTTRKVGRVLSTAENFGNLYEE